MKFKIIFSIFNNFTFAFTVCLFLFSCNNHDGKNNYNYQIIAETKKICKCKDTARFNRMVNNYLNNVNDSNLILYEIFNPFEGNTGYIPYFEHYLKERNIRIKKLLTNDNFKEDEIKPFFDSLCILENISTLLIEKKFGPLLIDSLKVIAKRDHRKDIIINRRFLNEEFDEHDSYTYFKPDSMSRTHGIITLNAAKYGLDKNIYKMDLEVQIDENGVLENSTVNAIYDKRDNIVVNIDKNVIYKFEKYFINLHKYHFTPCHFENYQYKCSRIFMILINHNENTH